MKETGYKKIDYERAAHLLQDLFHEAE